MDKRVHDLTWFTFSLYIYYSIFTEMGSGISFYNIIYAFSAHIEHVLHNLNF